MDLSVIVRRNGIDLSAAIQFARLITILRNGWNIRSNTLFLPNLLESPFSRYILNLKFCSYYKL